MAMYTQDKTKRMTLRLNEEMHDFVVMLATSYGCSPSDVVRMLIGASLTSYKRLVDKTDDMLLNELRKDDEVGLNEDDKTDIKHKL